MAFEIEEIEIEEYDPVKLMFTVVDTMRKAGHDYSCSKYLAEKKAKEEYDEFWSDICWTMPQEEAT